MQIMEILESTRGGQKVYFEGYLYTKQYERHNKIRWTCVRRNKVCKGSIMTNLQIGDVLSRNEHSHVEDETAKEIVKLRQQMKRKAENSVDKPCAIFAQTVLQTNVAVQTRLPSTDACKQAIRRTRRKHMPKVPDSLEDLVIEGEWASTGGEHSERFLLYDNGPNTDSRICLFATDENLKQLAEANTWFMDGSFSVAPHQFLQLYVIRVPLGDANISVVYAFMERKTHETYEELFRTLLTKCYELHLYPDPQTIIMDFEIAAIQAVQESLGNDVNIQGCFFHLCQNTWRKIQELGLVNLYRNDENFQLFCGKLNGLAFLPEDDVVAGMLELRNTAPEEAIELLNYFDANYVNGVYRRVQRQNGLLAFRRKAPRFPPKTWNVNAATVNGHHRTNNVSESWNNKFNQLVGHHHPSIWTAIRALQQEQSTVDTAILQDAIGHRPTKRTKRKHKDMQLRLKNLCSDYENGRKDIPNFLRGVGHNLRFME